MGLGRTYRLGGDLQSSYRGKPQRDGTIFMGNRHMYFDLAIGGGLCWIKWLKNKAGKGIIFHAIVPVL